MSDIYINIGNGHQEQLREIAECFRYYSHITSEEYSGDGVSVVSSRPDRKDIWGPAHDEASGVRAFLSGRIRPVAGAGNPFAPGGIRGGRACAYLIDLYHRHGDDLVQYVDGSFVAIIVDENRQSILAFNDIYGSLPLYGQMSDGEMLTISTHKDVLGRIVTKQPDIDVVSVKEFLATGRILPPHTYYRNVRQMEQGIVLSADIRDREEGFRERKYYDPFEEVHNEMGTDELAETLAHQVGEAVQGSLGGKSAYCMSGGLDSRMILSVLDPEADVELYHLCDDINLETRVAMEVVKRSGREMEVFRRSDDYYSRNARNAVKMSSGISWIISDHFHELALVLKENGYENLITGVYFDYYFKGLLLNTQNSKFDYKQRLGPFQYEYEYRYYLDRVDNDDAVRHRLEDYYGLNSKSREWEAIYKRVFLKRLLPVSCEPDSLSLIVPHKVLGCCYPVFEKGMFQVAQQLSLRQSLTKEVFLEALRRVCSKEVLKIPDADLGTSILTPNSLKRLLNVKHKVLNVVQKKLHPGRTRGSWPNWQNMLRVNPGFVDLWNQKLERFTEYLPDALDLDSQLGDIDTFHGKRTGLYYRLLTIKLWLDINGQI